MGRAVQTSLTALESVDFVWLVKRSSRKISSFQQENVAGELKSRTGGRILRGQISRDRSRLSEPRSAPALVDAIHPVCQGAKACVTLK
jgi:hypothetical protein